jgi:CheY-like chemotaxis protein
VLHKILLVDDTPTLLRQMHNLLRDIPHTREFYEAQNEEQAKSLIEKHRFSVVVTDLDLRDSGGTENGGFVVLAAALEREPDTQIVMVTSYMRAELPAEVRRRHGFSCVDRNTGYYQQQLPYEVTDAVRRFEKAARSRAPRAIKVVLPARSGDTIGFQLVPKDPDPVRTRRTLTLDFNAMKEATAGVGSLIHAGEPSQCSALSQFVGRYLWDRLFGDHDDLLIRFGEGRGIVDNPSHLPIQISGERDALDVPFELLHDGNHFLALQHPLVRTVRGAGATALMLPGLLKELKANHQPLRILLIAADTCSGNGLGLSSVPMVDEEVVLINKVVEDSQLSKDVHVKVLRSWEANRNLVEKTIRQGWHVVHYAGHGTYDTGKPPRIGHLHFWQGSCSQADWQTWRASGEDPVAARKLRGELLEFTSSDLSNCLEDFAPSLFYLSCCHSARTADTRSLLLSKSLGLVDAIASAGVPTVVGHRWPVVDTAHSLRFVTVFYEKLLSEYSPEQAILRARKELRDYDHIWASSVIFVQYPSS